MRFQGGHILSDNMAVIETNNPVIKLCVEGTRAEFERRIPDARILYKRAWELSRDDYEACIAAHYLARHQDTQEQMLHWNRAALNHAFAVGDDSVKDFYPSLCLNMGRSYELLGQHVEAQRYYALAAELGMRHMEE